MRFLALGATVFANVRQSIPVRLSVFIRTLYSSKGSLPRRSFLYMPGNDERKVFKAKDLNADCVVLDCEDGVATNKKEEARNTIHNLLGQVNFGSSEVCVRINSIETGLADDDLRLALTAKVLPHSIVVPKVETVEHINWISEKVAAHIKIRGHRIGLIAQVESALSLLNLHDVCEQGVSEERPFSLEALVFGSDDFLASIGATRTQDAKELTYARQSVVVHAKAYGLQAIDMFVADPEGLRVQAEEGASFGYTGKQIIHPSQVEIVNKAFSPSEERIKWAEGLVSAFEEKEKAGKGAIDFHGSMIDMPTVQQARNVLRLAKATKVPSD